MTEGLQGMRIKDLVNVGTPEAFELVVDRLDAFFDEREKMTVAQRGVAWGDYVRAVRAFPKLDEGEVGWGPIDAVEGLIYSRAEQMTADELGGLSAAYHTLVGNDAERWGRFLLNLQTHSGLDDKKIAVVRGAVNLSQV